jgi:hypothetical protein
MGISPQTVESGVPGQLSSTGGVLKKGSGVLTGIFVSSASATPTITVYDNTTGTGNPIIPTFTPAAATYYEFRAYFQNGLNVVLGGTVTGAAMYI